MAENVLFLGSGLRVQKNHCIAPETPKPWAVPPSALSTSELPPAAPAGQKWGGTMVSVSVCPTAG